VYSGLYYAVFRFAIQYFGLKTPGRDADDAVIADQPAPTDDFERAQAFVKALGGAANLVSVDACTTRLRLVVADQSAVSVDALKQLGSRGVVRPSANALQVVLGPIADQVAGDIRAALRVPGEGKTAAEARVAAPAAHVVASASALAPARAELSSSPTSADGLPFDVGLARQLWEALGGKQNVVSVGAASTRLRVTVRDSSSIDEGTLRALGVRGVAHPSRGTLHILIGPNANAAGLALQALA
jgi:PTS system N-acetylglucosamine-specific IIC component